jgi:predicted Zn-dependent protease with MMP-like domain
LYRHGLPEIEQPVIVVYRRPIEARAADAEDRADLVFIVVVDLAAEFLGRDVDEIDPPR